MPRPATARSPIERRNDKLVTSSSWGRMEGSSSVSTILTSINDTSAASFKFAAVKNMVDLRDGDPDSGIDDEDDPAWSKVASHAAAMTRLLLENEDVTEIETISQIDDVEEAMGANLELGDVEESEIEDKVEELPEKEEGSESDETLSDFEGLDDELSHGRGRARTTAIVCEDEVVDEGGSDEDEDSEESEESDEEEHNVYSMTRRQFQEPEQQGPRAWEEERPRTKKEHHLSTSNMRMRLNRASMNNAAKKKLSKRKTQTSKAIAKTLARTGSGRFSARRGGGGGDGYASEVEQPRFHTVVDLSKVAKQNILQLKWMKEPIYKPVEFYKGSNNTVVFGEAFLRVPALRLFRKWQAVYFAADQFTLRLYSNMVDLHARQNSLFELVLDVDLSMGSVHTTTTSTLKTKIVQRSSLQSSVASSASSSSLLRQPTHPDLMMSSTSLGGRPASVKTMHFFRTYYKDYEARQIARAKHMAAIKKRKGRGKSKQQRRAHAHRSGTKGKLAPMAKRSTSVALRAASENGYCKIAFDTRAEADCLQQVMVQARRHTINPELDPRYTNMASK